MADTKQEPDQAEPQMSKKSKVTLAFFGGFALMLAALGCFYLGTIGTVDARAQAADYHRAPGCTPSGVMSSGLPPCVFQTMTVTAKDATDDGNDGVDYTVGVRPPGGVEQEIPLYGRDKVEFFAHVTVGELVQVKTWQGQILILTIPGWHCGTPGHPDAQVYKGNEALVIGCFSALASGWALFYGWRAYKKEVPQGSKEAT